MLVLILHKNAKSLRTSIKIPLLLSVSIYLITSLSNLLEHQGITNYLDPMEDMIEVLYLSIFIFFINNWNKEEERKTISRHESWMEASFESLKDGIMTTDPVGRILSMNRVMEEMTGWSREEAKGTDCHKVIKLQNRADRQSQLFNQNRIISGGDDNPGGILLKSRKGGRTLVLVKSSLIKDTQDRTLGIISIFQDISRYNSLMEQLNQAQKMDALGQLAGTVAHDLNNILTGIRSTTDTLRMRMEKSDTPENQDLLDIVYQAMDSAEDLTSRLLSFCRKEEFDSRPMNIPDVIEDTILLARRSIQQELTLELEIPRAECIVKGEKSQLQNALLNLIFNARDAMGPDRGRITVSVSVVELDGESCRNTLLPVQPGCFSKIAVKDSGQGIPPEVKEKIFNPFFTTKEKGKGTGLGLAGVYNMLETHKGTITVSSQVGEGSEFALFLPLAAKSCQGRNK